MNERTATPMIHARGLEKHFGDTHALRGVDFDVEEGRILAVLGPNGAGKTTAVRILCTLTRADAGEASVAGFDVRRHPDEVRARIGLTGQFAALDELLTGRENVEMIARLYHLPAAKARRRADELLERFDLQDAANRTGEDLLGRHAASPRPCRQPRRRAADPLPRRADHGPRSAQPAGDVAAHQRAGGGRDDASCSPRSTWRRPTASRTRSR